MTKIYVDTGAFYALADTSDTRHTAATGFYVSARETNTLLTSSFVVVESWLLIRTSSDTAPHSNSRQGFVKASYRWRWYPGQIWTEHGRSSTRTRISNSVS